MKFFPIALLAGMVLLAACATAPAPQGDAAPEPVPAGITSLTQELEELAQEGPAVSLVEERQPSFPTL